MYDGMGNPFSQGKNAELALCESCSSYITLVMTNMVSQLRGSFCCHLLHGSIDTGIHNILGSTTI